MDDHNLNQIPTAARGIVLLANLFGRARDLVQTVQAEIMAADDGVPIILERLCKRDSLCMTSFIFGELKSVLSCRRATSETHVALEARFAAQVSKCNIMDPISTISECMAAYYLHDAANVDDCQRIAIMGTASLKDAALTPRSSTGSILRAVTYESVASVLRK